MAEIRFRLDEPLGLPEDLREWLAPQKLVEMVFEALHIAIEQNRPGLSGETFPTGIPRTFLTLLTYSYVTGLYASDAIEGAVAGDPELSYLAANTVPSACSLRQFRRHHRAELSKTLSKVLELAWNSRVSPLGGIFVDRPQVLSNRPAAHLETLFAWAADSRINEAILADSAALDN